jgi:segregation and condensation protein B
MRPEELKCVLEAALFAAGRPLSIDDLAALWEEEADKPERAAIRTALETLQRDYTGHGVYLKEVASGFRFQVRRDYALWISRLWAERPARTSRAFLETLALIAYRQPVTRTEIEEIRGVSVSTSIMHNLLERRWIRVVGHRETPGRPALYGTTREFLNHFSLKSLQELPSLKELEQMGGSAANGKSEDPSQITSFLPGVSDGPDTLEGACSSTAPAVAKQGGVNFDSCAQSGEEDGNALAGH